MRYVEQHLTKHHLFRAPHRWFFAFLLSPIHAAEMHYKHRYHLQYTHAKKLFFFDLTLLVSVIVLAAVTMSWFLYDPTVTDKLHLSMALGSETESFIRIKSGDDVVLVLTYANDSGKKLEDAHLAIALPAGFVVSHTTPDHAFNLHTKTFALDTIAPGGSGTVSIAGTLYGTPGKEETVSSHLSYVQEGNAAREIKTSRMFLTLRDSTLAASIQGPQSLDTFTVFAESAIPITFSLTNTSKKSLPPLITDLPSFPGVTLTDVQVSTGTVANNRWSLSGLTPNESVHGTATAVLHLPAATDMTTLTLGPNLVLSGHEFPQTDSALRLTIMEPQVQIKTAWKDGAGVLRPGDTATLTATITNNSGLVFTNPRIVVPIDERIIAGQKNPLSIPAVREPGLNHLAPGEKVTVEIPFTLRSLIETGEAVSLSLAPSFTAAVSGIETQLTKRLMLSERPIATSLRLTAESRYYTVDGDQLGRGSLPPVVGKETKYWAFITLKNGTGTAVNTIVSATLPPGVTATGKQSVTAGKPPVTDTNSRTIRWTLSTLAPHQEAGLYLELSVKPTDADRGKHLPLLTNITVNGTDEQHTLPLSATTPRIDTSLPTDPIGKAKGTAVRQ